MTLQVHKTHHCHPQQNTYEHLGYGLRKPRYQAQCLPDTLDVSGGQISSESRLLEHILNLNVLNLKSQQANQS